VVGPAPRGVSLQQVEDGFFLRWREDTCKKAIGYKIYRRVDSSHWSHGYCEIGVLGHNNGYQFLAMVNGVTNITYLDNASGAGLSPGNVYCYLVTAVYTSTGANNNAILGTETEGYASEEVCGEIVKSKPVITNVSVEKTGASGGVIKLAWSKPTAMDSILYPGPYKYVILRAPGFNGTTFSLVDSLSSASFALFNDTLYIDSFLNTVQTPFTYKIEFYSDSFGLKRQSIGKSQSATSVFLSAAPGDQFVQLSWNEFVPWVNSSYVIYRKNGNVFDSIGVSTVKSYVDQDLANGQEYCYYVKSVGSFSSPGYVDPVLNNSQEICASPKDTVASCAPGLGPPPLDMVSGCVDFRNKIRWNNPNHSCANDVVKYNIYFTAKRDVAPFLIATLNSANDTFYTDERDALKRSIAGCYTITAIDSFGNESKPSNPICYDNCPEYVLPNVFTPGTVDGNNDMFLPFPYKFVDHIELTIFNRWGQKVFSTNDPDINWQGTDESSGKVLGAGVYYFLGKVYEIRLDGNTERKLQGTITIIR
jgi:gliding motility-associated-like protein